MSYDSPTLLWCINHFSAPTMVLLLTTALVPKLVISVSKQIYCIWTVTARYHSCAAMSEAYSQKWTSWHLIVWPCVLTQFVPLRPGFVRILLILKSTFLATRFLEWIEIAEVMESQSTSDIQSARQFTLSWVLVSPLLSSCFCVYPLHNKGLFLVSSIVHPVLTPNGSSIFRTHLNIFTIVTFKIYLYVEILISC